MHGNVLARCWKKNKNGRDVSSLNKVQGGNSSSQGRLWLTALFHKAVVTYR